MADGVDVAAFLEQHAARASSLHRMGADELDSLLHPPPPEPEEFAEMPTQRSGGWGRRMIGLLFISALGFAAWTFLSGAASSPCGEGLTAHEVPNGGSVAAVIIAHPDFNRRTWRQALKLNPQFDGFNEHDFATKVNPGDIVCLPSTNAP